MQLYFVQSSDRRGDMDMKDVVLNEVKKELNWKERIIIKIFGNLFYYVYRKGMIDCFKYYNKQYFFLLTSV